METTAPRRWLRALAGACVGAAVVAAAGTPAGATAQAGVYADAATIGRAITQQGVRFGGRRVAVRSATCTGLPAYGVRLKPYFRKEYRRFTCRLVGTNARQYLAQIEVRSPAPRVTFRVVSIRRLL